MGKKATIDFMSYVSVKITVRQGKKTGEGSGIIVCDCSEGYHILTAAHVLRCKDEKDISNDIDCSLCIKGKKLQLEVLSVAYANTSADVDLAAISIKKPSVEFNYAEKVKICPYINDDEDFFFYGFPASIEKGRMFDVKANGVHLWHLGENISGTYTSATNAISGVSGSAVCFYQYNVLFIVGIVKNLSNNDGIFDDVNTRPCDMLEQICPNVFQRNMIDIAMEWSKKDYTEMVAKQSQTLENEKVEWWENIRRKMGILYNQKEEQQQKMQVFISDYCNGFLFLEQLDEKYPELTSHLDNTTKKLLDNMTCYDSEEVESKKEAREKLKELTNNYKAEINNIIDSNNRNEASGLYYGLARHYVSGDLLKCNLNFTISNNND